MDDRKVQFKMFTTPFLIQEERIEDAVNQFLRDYRNVEIVGQSQSQTGLYVTLCIFFKSDGYFPEE